MKHAFLQLMRASGAFATFRLANRRKLLIVTYHRFSADRAYAATSAAMFAEQLAYLRARYTIVPLSAVERYLREGLPLPAASAAITIDDGYHDAYEVAFPILQRYAVPATLFAATDFIDQKSWLWTDKVRFMAFEMTTNRLSADVGGSVVHAELEGPISRFQAADRLNALIKNLPEENKEQVIASIATQVGITLPILPPAHCRPLTWNELREMAAAGVEIGSHTVTHPILPCVGTEQLTRELTQSRTRLEEMLGRQVTLFCYPNGDYDQRVRGEVERAGYRLAVTTEEGLNDASTDPLALRRIHTEGDLTHFIQSTSGFGEMKNSVRGSIESRTRVAPHDAMTGAS